MTNVPSQQPAPEIPVEYVTRQVPVKPYAGFRLAAALLAGGSLILNVAGVPSVLAIVFAVLALVRMSTARAAGYPVKGTWLMVAALIVSAGTLLLALSNLTRLSY